MNFVSTFPLTGTNPLTSYEGKLAGRSSVSSIWDQIADVFLSTVRTMNNNVISIYRIGRVLFLIMLHF